MVAIALISDLHGNSPALRAVLADIRDRGVEAVYCLGDLVGYGPDPNGVIDLVREAGIPTVMGNYDDGVGWERGDCGCFYASAEAKKLGDASYRFTVDVVTAERKAFLRGLHPELHVDLSGVRLHLVHGSPRKVNEYLLRNRDERTFLRLAKSEGDDALVFGHTHDAWHRLYGGVLFVSVGSVGRPKDGDPRAMYTILEARSGSSVEVEELRVSYDVEPLARAIEDSGLPAELAQALREGR